MTNLYYCAKCYSVVRRRSKRTWINSYCSFSGMNTRLIKVDRYNPPLTFIEGCIDLMMQGGAHE